MIVIFVPYFIEATLKVSECTIGLGYLHYYIKFQSILQYMLGWEHYYKVNYISQYVSVCSVHCAPWISWQVEVYILWYDFLSQSGVKSVWFCVKGLNLILFTIDKTSSWHQICTFTKFHLISSQHQRVIWINDITRQ